MRAERVGFAASLRRSAEPFNPNHHPPSCQGERPRLCREAVAAQPQRPRLSAGLPEGSGAVCVGRRGGAAWCRAMPPLR